MGEHEDVVSEQPEPAEEGEAGENEVPMMERVLLEIPAHKVPELIVAMRRAALLSQGEPVNILAVAHEVVGGELVVTEYTAPASEWNI